MLTQNEMILALLVKAGPDGVTPLQALNECGVLRLAARINDLKTMIPASDEIITERASANGKTFARYVLRHRTAQATLW